jgi:hypothetical protein
MTLHILTSLLLAEAILLPARAEESFQPLFNGRDLSGWVVVNTAPSTWHFDGEGLLVCSGKPIGEIRTERMYQNFILELEWRHLVPKGNAGVFIWADDITARGQPFHRGIEVQVLENAYGDTQSHTTHGDIFPIHGAIMTPVNGRGGSRAFPTESRSKPSPEWNHYRIECQDGNISLAVNGKVVTRGENCSPRKGYICLESEGGVVNYRNVRIHELPDSPVDPKDVAMANRGFRSLYTGVDLSGWTGGEGWTVNDWILSSAGKSSLRSETSFDRAGGFIVDFRFAKESRGAQIQIAGATIDLAPAGPGIEPPGKWNRVEGKWENGQLTVTANAQAIEAKAGTVDSQGPLILQSEGPVDWANLYVRRIPAENP